MAPVAAGIAILVAGVVPPSRDPRTPPVDWSGDVAIRCSTSDCSETPRFTAASGAVTVAFFALSGFIFLVTQYFQFLKAYSPFATGVRLLPVAASVAISSLVGTRLAVRVGNKLVVTTGLSLLCGAFVWISTASQASTYLEIAAQVLVLGTGMGLTSAPATEAIMGVVSKEQAGVGSAVNDATRLLGGTLGVAVIGSVAASLYAGCLGALGVAAAGALVAWFALLPARPRRAIPAAGSTLPAAHSRPLSRLRAAG